jgi:hypothetical protein
MINDADHTLLCITVMPNTHTHTHTYIYIYIYIYIYMKHVTNITSKLCNARDLNYSDMEFKVVNQPFRKNRVSLCRRTSIG